MTMEQSQTLQFTVKEAVWFERGQEISDVLSMSLEPDISIQEHQNYVSIRGALELVGEYYPKEGTEEETAQETFHKGQMVRTIDRVTESEDNVFMMNHQFPIDITIPMNRIKNLDDVYVMVQSFDYELPDDGTLQLVAELSISGIAGERKAEPEEDALTYEDTPTNKDESFEGDQVEELRNYEDEAEQEVKNDMQSSYNEEENNENFPSFEVEARQEIKEEVREEIVYEEKEKVELGGKLDEPKGKAVEELVEEVKTLEGMEEVDEEAADKSPLIELKGRIEKSQAQQEEQVALSTQSETDTKVSKRDENALYLTKMLTSEGEENFSTLRMRIVQQGESLDVIASSYDVPVTKLIQMNNLEDDHVQEGSIIYVPAMVE